MTPEILIKKLLAQREFWVDLAGGQRVKLRRPAEADVLSLLARKDGKVVGLSIGLPEIKRFAVDWEGFTEALLIPSGASDAVPFTADLWACVIEDRAGWVAACSAAIAEKIVEHENRTEAALGN